MGPKRLSNPGTLSTGQVPVIAFETVVREDSSTLSLDSKVFIPSDKRECFRKEENRQKNYVIGRKTTMPCSPTNPN